MTGVEECIRRWRVRGRVQGVGFRASTVQKARALGIVEGWARNLADGSVDVCAAGDTRALQALEDWLWRGPSFARVTSVEAVPPPGQRPPAFGRRD